MNLLEVRNATVRYGVITALHSTSIQVEKGTVACLIGANGAGKTTLLNAIMGLVPMSTGEIMFDGHIIASDKGNTGTDRIVAQGAALVPEGRRVFADLTVAENLEMGGFLVRDDNLLHSRQEQMYALFPILKQRYRQKARSLSGGEQQMLAIARALMSGPKLLLLDEPGLGLAPLIIKQIFEIIQQINQEDGVTVFLVEQNAKIALEASQHGYVLETGHVVHQGDSKYLLKDPKVKAAYLGE
ncbi:MAG: ABC transporter ATP-binding protein [Spirochaeta sp.]